MELDGYTFEYYTMYPDALGLFVVKNNTVKPLRYCYEKDNISIAKVISFAK